MEQALAIFIQASVIEAMARAMMEPVTHAEAVVWVDALHEVTAWMVEVAS